MTLQLMAEERVGFVLRERQRMARELEDQAFASAAGASR
jgi:hypothetical protein